MRFAEQPRSAPPMKTARTGVRYRPPRKEARTNPNSCVVEIQPTVPIDRSRCSAIPARRNGVETKTTVLEAIATRSAGATAGCRAESSLTGTCIYLISGK
jgi:hypothetical protein